MTMIDLQSILPVIYYVGLGRKICGFLVRDELKLRLLEQYPHHQGWRQLSHRGSGLCGGGRFPDRQSVKRVCQPA